MNEKARKVLADGTHVLIAGATGSGEEYGGKTVLANWWFEGAVQKGHVAMGVFFNAKKFTFVRGETVESLDELADAYAEGVRLFDYRPQGDRAEEHAALMQLLLVLPGKKIVVHDEAQSYRGDSLHDALAEWGNMEGADLPTDDIRSLVLTQRPWNLPEEYRLNLPVKVWVGPFGSEAETFFDSEKMQAAAARTKEETGPYRWTITDAGDYVDTMDPVPAAYAEAVA